MQLFLYNFLRHANLNSISSSVNDVKISSLISLLLYLPFFSSSLFLMLRTYEQKINTLITYVITKNKLKSNSVLFTDAISLKKTKL